jgi:WD40 repeat protein
MRTCHNCHVELEPAALAAGTCPHCGAIVHKVARRTIEGKGLLADDPSTTLDAPSGETFVFDLDSVHPDVSETDKGGPTLVDSPRADSAGDDDKDPSRDTNVPVQPIDFSELEKQLPTVPDRPDMTMDLGWMLSQGASQDPSKTSDDPSKTSDQFNAPDELPPKMKNRRSTHTLESDATVDLSMATSDEAKLDSQWRGTFDHGTKQSHTIRQKETVTGFRSSLPVKSRYIREKRKSPSAPPSSLAEVPDYELLDIIGEGGMGVVYAAHQSSIARTVAVKMLKPSAKVREDQRDKFISEAVVTGELDHPNIVPIYDLGSNEQGALFYSMKRVRGTPWDKVIDHKQLDENLSILLRVADAVAFAHAGGVIHRDLKPENVMLGDYGEVLVMDWGLARITPEFAHKDTVYQADSLGGTPAYMAPEMARGPVDKINKTADVYLLGAILYEIIGGQPPHSGRDVMQCLMAASQNKIDPIRYEGELKAIALKAMATRQEDRYQTVKEFQEAVRVYQSHSESLVLTAHANQNLQKARAASDYALYARALYGCQESLTLWDGNHRARTLLKETQFDYASCALNNGDLDLAGTLLDTSHDDHQALMTKIEAARQERDARQRRLKMAKFAVAALVAGIILTTTIGLFFVNLQRNRAIAAQKEEERQKTLAVEAERKAVAAKEEAVESEKKAVASEKVAVAAKDEEEKQKQAAIAAQRAAEAAQKKEEQARIAEEVQRKEAERAKEAEEYESYIAQIGLASAKIDENAFDFALQLLEDTQPARRNWEWGRLYHLCKLNTGAFDTGTVDAVAYAPDGKSFAMGDRGGKVTVIDLQTGKKRVEVPHGGLVLSVAYSPDGRHIASGSTNDSIKIIDAASGRELKTLIGQKVQANQKPNPSLGHSNDVLSVRFSPDGKQLLSGSLDETARLWDLATGQVLQTLQGHSWWVWAAEFSPDGNRIVTAGQDGKAVVWQKAAVPKPQGLYTHFTEFTGHNGAIYTARFSPKGDRVATGGYDKLVMVWNPDEVRPIDIKAQLDNNPQPPPKALRFAGHDGPVRCVAFSPNGQLVLSGSEDNSLRVWDMTGGKDVKTLRTGEFVDDQTRAPQLTEDDAVKTLRGHGYAVRSCAFSPDGRFILASDDKRVCLWDVAGYEESRVLHSTVFVGHDDAVLSARYSPDGQRVILASRDRTATLWDTATGKGVRRFHEGHEFLVSSAQYFPNGKYIATGAGDNTVRVWNATAGTELASYAPTGRVGTLAVSPDNRWIATGSVPQRRTGNATRNEVQIWAAPTEQDQGRPEPAGLDAVEKVPVAKLAGHEAVVSALAFSPNGELLASGDDDGRVRLWKRGNNAWSFDRELRGHNESVTAISFTPDGRRLITASGDKTCAQWDLATGNELDQLRLKHDKWVSSLDLSANGQLALTTCDDRKARLWRLAGATVLAQVESRVAGKKEEDQHPFNFVAFSPDDSRAVLTSYANKLVSLWDLSTAAAGANQQTMVEPALDFNKEGSEVWAATFSPDGRHVLTIGGNDAQLWAIDPPKLAVMFSPHGAVASAAVSPDGKHVATGSWDRSAKIWDIDTGKSVQKLNRVHGAYINSVEFSPDGRELLTASDDRTARLWDLATGKPIGAPFQGHTDRLLGATFSPDATRILTVSGDKTARIWDRAGGKPPLELKGHALAVMCGRFSPNGDFVITGSQDKSAVIWNALTAEQVLTLTGHTAAVTSVAISPDGTRAVTGSQDNTVKLWDATPGQADRVAKEILTLPGHTEEVTSVSFSPNGRDVLTSSRDGTAIIWLASDWHDQQAKPAVAVQRP